MADDCEIPLDGSVYGIGKVREFVRCINCEEQRQLGTICSCGYMDPGDAELCGKCGAYKPIGVSCRSAACQPARTK